MANLFDISNSNFKDDKFLKKNPFDEAILCTMLEGCLSDEDKKNFRDTNLCKHLVSNDTITDESIEKIQNGIDKSFELCVLNIANDNNDPLLTKLIKNRRAERELLNELIDKYATEADILKTRKINELSKNIPESYINKN